MMKTDEHLYTLTRSEFANEIGKSREAVKKNMRRGKYKDLYIFKNNQYYFKTREAVRSDIPAVTHVDYSVRIQTVHKSTNPRYYKLLQSFKKITGCPVLVNTSFNIRGEPIVCSVEDAYRCFMGTNLDILICGNFILYKDKQNIELKEKYKNKFTPD